MSSKHHAGVVALRTAICASSVVLAADGLAQQQGPVGSEPMALEEIVVTARKTREDVQDIPLTVDVLTADALVERGVTNLSQINGLAPNFVWEDFGGSTTRNAITIRGISSNDSFLSFDPGVGVYVDEVYQASGLAFNSALLDIDRVEVLKGPQGTLFGRNTTAGAISITTRRPSLEKLYAQGEVEIGNYALRQFKSVVNVPLSQRTAVKLAGIYRERDGYTLNTVTDKRDVNDESHHGGRAQLLIEPTEAIQIVASAHWYKDRASQGLPDCAGPGALGNLCSGEDFADLLDRRVEANVPNDTDRDSWGGSLVAALQTRGGYTLTSISAYSRLEAVEHQDQDFTKVDLLRSGGFGVPRQWQGSQELRLATRSDRRLRGVAGIYYLGESKDLDIPITLTPFALAFLGLPPDAAASAHTLATMTTDSYAVYGQGSYELTPSVIAELGVRYTRDEKSLDYEQQVDDAVLGLPGIPVRVAPVSAGDSWGAVSSTASVSWHVTDDIMSYVRYSRGYKSGGFNAATAVPGQLITRPYDPEYLDSIEAGLKFQSANRRFRANLAAFTIDYDDLQFSIANELRQVYVANAGKATSDGLELAMSFVPLSGLIVDANVGVQNARYEKFTATGLANLSGKDLTYAPPVTASASATYTFPLSATVEASISGTANYRADTWLDRQNTVEARDYMMVNARAGVYAVNGRWGAYLYSNNLNDVTRLVAYGGPGFSTGSTGFANAPRTFGIQLRASF